MMAKADAAMMVACQFLPPIESMIEEARSLKRAIGGHDDFALIYETKGFFAGCGEGNIDLCDLVGTGNTPRAALESLLSHLREMLGKQDLADCIRSGQVPQEDVPKIMAEKPDFAKWYAEKYGVEE